MPKFAQFDPAAPAPQPVIGWYDTDALDYPNLPPAEKLLKLTESQWDGRMDTPFVQAGLLIAAPAPTAAQLLVNAQAVRLSVLSAACAAQIYAGFVSSALGAAYTYPAKDKDQSNLVASVTASLVPGIPTGWTTSFWCVDAAGIWAFRPHTAAQIQKAGLDGKAAIETALQKNGTLANQVSAITVATPNAVAAVQAIIW